MYYKPSIDLADEYASYLSLESRGTPGLKEMGGYVFEEFLRQLSGSKGIRLYAEMERNSACIGAIRRLVRDIIRQVEWGFEPAEDSPTPSVARAECDFLESNLDDMDHTWSDMIGEALTMLEYGFAPMYQTYKLRRGDDPTPEFNSKYDDGRFGWRSIELRAQETLGRWEFEEPAKRLRGMWQRDMYSWAPNVFLPIERLVLFRNDVHKGNPEGRSLFRNAVIPYLRMKHVEEIEAVGVQRDLVGLPIMHVPQSMLSSAATDDEKSIIAEIERQLGALNNHERSYLIMPAEDTPDGKKTGFKFDLQRSPGSKQLDVVAISNKYATQIFQSCLAQFLMLGQNGNGGARALSSDQTDLFSLSLGAILCVIRDTFQRSAVDRLCKLNGVRAENIPRLKFGDIETPNLQQLGAYLQALANSGTLVPDEELEAHLRSIANLPAKQQDIGTADDLAQRALDDVRGVDGKGKPSGSADAQMRAALQDARGRGGSAPDPRNSPNGVKPDAPPGAAR